jgi:colicin import membrane protein
MAKLDWSRVSLRVMDPARYQRGADIVLAPDADAPPKKRKVPRARKKPKNPSPAQLARQAEHEARLAQNREARRQKKAAVRAGELERQRLKRLAKEKRRQEARLQQAEAQQRKDEKRAAQKAAAEAKRAAFLEYQKTPEYAAKIARKRAEMEAKKKTHFEAWVDQLVELKGDRESLRQRWKDKLLNKALTAPPNSDPSPEQSTK